MGDVLRGPACTQGPWSKIHTRNSCVLLSHFFAAARPWAVLDRMLGTPAVCVFETSKDVARQRFRVPHRRPGCGAATSASNENRRRARASPLCRLQPQSSRGLRLSGRRPSRKRWIQGPKACSAHVLAQPPNEQSSRTRKETTVLGPLVAMHIRGPHL